VTLKNDHPPHEIRRALMISGAQQHSTAAFATTYREAIFSIVVLLTQASTSLTNNKTCKSEDDNVV
jgi:hypothetical protein